ncbi:protein kinase [candidate division KSB1 bacterium]|nr:protein kinase [candidate division KSB1 bacterium]
MTPLDNSILDNKYEIVHEIKRGGFGIVYFGLDKRLNKPIAIKKIVPDLVGEENFLEMFHEEALNVARLNHNNIVHIYDLKKTADGHLYIIMEYIDGYDLEKIIRALRKSGQKMSPYLAAHIVAEICVALDYANQRLDTLTNKPLNLVHQDVSPSNIMVTRHGGVKLIDFGISSVKLHQKTEKKSPKLRGKIPYMAPEQLIRGNIPDHRSDLFSLGLVLYEVLSGQRIFNSREDVYASGKNAKLFKKAIKDPSFPRPLDKIISNALEPDIRQRYQRANKMHFDLVNYIRSRNESGELADYLIAMINQYSNWRKNLPATQVELTSGESSTDNSAMSKWNDIEINEKTEVNTAPQQNSVSTPQATNKTIYTTDPVFKSDEYIGADIDVIRESVRDNKNKIIQYCFGFVLILFVFGILDTINGWTRAGVWMRDLFFSPTLEITTIPVIAEFYLDGRKIAEKSPIEITDIAPGVHELEMVREGFRPITKSLFVSHEGEIRIQGEGKNGNQNYQFRFSAEVEINSNPQGAQVYLNGVLLNQKTPCTAMWEAGTPFALELERPGFNRLTGFSMNGMNGTKEAKDHRFWEVKVLKDDDVKYSVTGIFKKRMVLETSPQDVEIYDLKSNRRLIPEHGNTILLALGSHALEFRKASFISKKLELNITEESSSKITAVLSRNVLFTATNASGNNADIGADLVSLKNGTREFLKSSKKTPLNLTLPAYTYEAIFAKPGYQSRQITVGPNSRNVTARMNVAKAIVDVKVIDALSGQPISGADIYYNPGDNLNAPQSPFAKTDLKGRGLGQLTSGKYLFTVNYRGFRPLTRNLLVRAGESYALVFKIYPSN